tara:strand:- start:770 stop:1153 length:384 start_codon:yes stop_codon:yes gene_type:complete
LKKNTTIRISEKAINYYTANYKTNHAGCVLACEGYPKLRDEALRNLKSWNIFRDEELYYLKSASKDVVVDKGNIASLKLWEAEIYEYYQTGNSGISDEHFRILIEKLRELPLMERFVLRENILQESL